MLVLSRRPNEKVVFPDIQTSVQVIAIKPGVVRLGIEGPPEVRVFREEVLDRAEVARPVAGPKADHPIGLKLRELNHMVRNRLNAMTIGVALLRRQIKAGLTSDSEATLDKVEQEIRSLRRQVESAAESTPAARARKPRKALLVEDDRNERELLAGFLRMAGLDVATAGDGTDALDYLRHQGPPDVVLLDMVLPRCDGPTTVREIRRDPAFAGLKIFGVSGHSPERFNLDSGAAGIDRWFHKPLNPEALLHDLSREWGDVE